MKYSLEQGKKAGKSGSHVSAAALAGKYDTRAVASVAFQEFSEAWAREALRVLKPGGHLVSFASTRTYHRMVVGIEDAGFEIRDQLAWTFGSGFPKSLNLEGDREGWGTALKPAWEPIVLARKPLDGTVAENVAKWGTGALNIDGCRIEGEKGSGNWKGVGGTAGKLYEGGFSKKSASSQNAKGRWPANLCHDGSEEVICGFPESDGQQGDLVGHSKDRKTKTCYGDMGAARDAIARNDSGSAARFFYCAKASAVDREEGLEAFDVQVVARSNGAQGEQGREEEEYGEKTDIGLNKINRRRNIHPTVKPTKLMRWLVRLVTPPGGRVLDPFNGSGSTGKACMLEGFHYMGIDVDTEGEYLPIAKARIVYALAHRDRWEQIHGASTSVADVPGQTSFL